jgi:hypothetical protein
MQISRGHNFGTRSDCNGDNQEEEKPVARPSTAEMTEPEFAVANYFHSSA